MTTLWMAMMSSSVQRYDFFDGMGYVEGTPNSKGDYVLHSEYAQKAEWSEVTSENLPRLGDEVLEVWFNKSARVFLTICTHNWDDGLLYLPNVPVKVYRRPLNVPKENNVS